MVGVRKIFNVDCVLCELIIQAWKCVCIASIANFYISQMSSLSLTSSFSSAPLIFFGSRRLRVEWHWKVDFTKKVWTWTEVVKRQLLIFCTSTFISSYYWRQWRCRDDPFSCWFIFGLTWRSACHGVKNYFSQEIISPLLLLLTYTLHVSTVNCFSTMNHIVPDRSVAQQRGELKDLQ